MTITNTLEGAIFAHPMLLEDYDLGGYIQGLYPELDDREVAAAVLAYSDIGTLLEQMTAVYGECKGLHTWV